MTPVPHSYSPATQPKPLSRGQVWQEETWMSPSHWASNLLLYDSVGTGLTAWSEASLFLAEQTSYLGTGEEVVASNATKGAINLHSAAAGDTFWGIGAPSSDVTNGQGKPLLGARTLGFYLLTASATPKVVLDIYGTNQWGNEIVERVQLTQRTHSSYGSDQPVPVTAGFYDPNGFGIGGASAATWSALSVVRGLQTLNAFSEFHKAILISKHSTTAGDRIVVHAKTMQFGLRNPISSLDDVVAGYVEGYPVHAGVEWTDSPYSTSNSWGTDRYLTQYGPYVSEIKREFMSVDTTYNLVQFDNTKNSLNRHSAKVATTVDDTIARQWFEWHGEFMFYANFPWKLTLMVRPY